MTSEPRRLPLRRILLILLALLSATAASTWLWISGIAAKRMSRLEEQVRQLHHETLARDGARSPLHGDPIPGNAWSDYLLVLAETQGLARHEKQLSDFYHRVPNTNLLDLRAIIHAHGDILASLRRGPVEPMGTIRSTGSWAGP
jgi:hypothetical protein